MQSSIRSCISWEASCGILHTAVCEQTPQEHTGAQGLAQEASVCMPWLSLHQPCLHHQKLLILASAWHSTCTSRQMFRIGAPT